MQEPEAVSRGKVVQGKCLRGTIDPAQKDTACLGGNKWPIRTRGRWEDYRDQDGSSDLLVSSVCS